MKTLALRLVILNVALATAAFAAPPSRFSAPLAAGGVVVEIARVPAAILLAPIRPFLHRAEPVSGRRLSADAGWSRLGFPLEASGDGLLLEVRGRAQLGRVEIVFADGELHRVEVGRDHVYRPGLYRLRWFGSGREVRLVRLEARARSSRAALDVRVARETAPSAATRTTAW